MAYLLTRCLHHLWMDARRDKTHPEHCKWVQSGCIGLASVLVGSALCDDAGVPIGHSDLPEAESLGDARRFAEGDPFCAAGKICEIDIALLPEGFRADRIAIRT